MGYEPYDVRLGPSPVAMLTSAYRLRVLPSVLPRLPVSTRSVASGLQICLQNRPLNCEFPDLSSREPCSTTSGAEAAT